MTTREQAIPRLLNVVHNGDRHTNYKRTMELAKLYRQLVSGDGLDELLRQFVQRETDVAFQQRKDLTNHVVTTVSKNIMDIFYKVPRSNYQRVFEHAGDSGDKKTKILEDILAKFWGVKDLDSYMQTRWLELNAQDPNAFIVVEFQDFDHRVTRAAPYPFEVSSTQAIDYQYQNNVLQYLTVKTMFPLPTEKDQKRIGDKYTVYLAKETLVLTELDETTITANLEEGVFVLTVDGMLLKSKQRIYRLDFPTPHNAGTVPAHQVGYARDPWTNGATFVSPFDSAVPLLKKSIKVNSELDITMSQQVFPHRAQYMPKCKAPECLGGNTANGSACTVCKGTGHASITSAQEIIYLNLPKQDEPLWDLDKLLVFKGPPIDIVQFQADYVESLTANAKAAVFNSENFTREQIQSTATGKMLDRDNVQDTLYTCAIGYAETWGFLVNMSAKFTELHEGLDAKIVFSKDFKLKGITELVADLESAKRSESGPAVVGHIQDNIARLMYAEDPQQYTRWRTKDFFNPFSGYSSDMVSLALTDSSIPQKYKTRYLMMGVIFSEIEEDVPDFYEQPTTEQTRLIDDKVAKYIEASASSTAPILPATPPGTPPPTA